jgi:hypothetical protein
LILHRFLLVRDQMMEEFSELDDDYARRFHGELALDQFNVSTRDRCVPSCSRDSAANQAMLT